MDVDVINAFISVADNLSIVALLLWMLHSTRQTAATERVYYRSMVRALVVALVVALADGEKAERVVSAVAAAPDGD